MSTKAVKGTEVDGDVAVGRHVTVGGDANVRGNFTVDGSLIVEGRVIAPDISGGSGSGNTGAMGGESAPTVLFFDVFDTESVLNANSGATAPVRTEVAPLGAEIVWCSRDGRFYGRFAGEFYYAFAGHKQYGELNGKGITCKPDVLYVHRTGDVYIRRSLVNSSGSTYYTLAAVGSELIKKMALRSLVYEAATRKLIGKSADGSMLTEVALPTATSDSDGLMSNEDKSTMDSLKLMQGAFENTGVATLKGTPVYMIDVLVRVPSGTEQPELPTPEEFGAQGGELVVAMDYDGNVRFIGIVVPADSGGGCEIRELPLAMTREDISAGKWQWLNSDRRLVRRASTYYLRGGCVYSGTVWDNGEPAAFVADEEGALRCLSDTAALNELLRLHYALEEQYEEEMSEALDAAEGVVNLGVVASEAVALNMAAERAIAENPKVREIRWRTSDSQQTGDGNTIFQSVYGNWYVVQTMLFGGQSHRCRVRTITTGGNYQVGAWQELILPVGFTYNASTRTVSAQDMAMTGGFPTPSGTSKTLFTLPLATTYAAGLMSGSVMSRLGTGASIYEGTPTATEVPVSYPNWAAGGARTFTLGAATSARAGVMTAADKKNLDALTDASRQFTIAGECCRATDGAIVEDAEYCRTELIPINHRYSVLFQGGGSSPVAKVAFFDVDRNFIGAIPYGESSSIPNIPANAAYFIASTKTAALSGAKYVHAETEEAKAGALSDVVALGEASYFRKYWQVSGGTIDDEGHPTAPYGLNGLWLTYEEAVKVAAESMVRATPIIGRIMLARTNFEPVHTGNAQEFSNFRAENAEALRLNYIARPTRFINWLFNAPKLKRIIGDFDLTYFTGVVTSALVCPLLEDVHFGLLKTNLDIRHLKSISLASLTYLVNNAANGATAITVTVHAEVYAKLTDEAQADWFALLTSATAKNISFATV